MTDDLKFTESEVFQAFEKAMKNTIPGHKDTTDNLKDELNAILQEKLAAAPRVFGENETDSIWGRALFRDESGEILDLYEARLVCIKGIEK